MNIGTMRSQAARFCGDPDVTRYAAADYLNALNLAQNQFALETRALWKDTTWSSVANDATYALPTDFMWEDELHFNGLPLTPLSRKNFTLLSPDSDWTIVTGTPTHFLVDPEEAQKQLLLYPIPTANDAQKTIAMRYIPFPVALAADSDVPLNSSALMQQFHVGLCAYAAWLLLASEETTQLVSEKRRSLLGIYADSRDKAIKTFKNTVSAPWVMRGSRVNG